MKGQAFDVFKLVIAAAVGMIMLGLLLSILGGLSTPGGQPLPETKRLLSETYYQGIARTSAAPVKFTRGDVITVASMVKGTGIPESKVEIKECISPELECSNGKTITATANIDATVIVDCLDVSSSVCKIKYISPVK